MSKLRSDLSIEQLNQLGSDCLPGMFGMEMTELAEGLLKSRMLIKSSHLALNGYLHAATIVALADTTCGNASMAHLPEGAISFTTIELKSNHLGTVRQGAICCEASAQHLGKSTQVWDAVVADEVSGKRIALFRCTQMVLWPKG
ncbi:competence protein ComA [Pseudomonas aeruginosa]|uniref:PaaI family thioesterase n=1 Tax=Pseudomonas aeruginosa TaxID=287 RepID=UPI000BB99D77|nr:PaaI family thioesterase [Pseudomonas aeruginosa]PBZ54988.1 competence protein ComA [Pseudomonas aeruginosa]PBZ60729.1 competence protein ComA [Pseudomonas aeruginosa]PBZ67648.1 competence protein ComA [Pseudomonas aeruginosa]